MRVYSHEEIVSAACRILAEQAAVMPCACRPYRGRTTRSRHFPFCPWNTWYEGFLAGVAAAGIVPHELPEMEIASAEVDGSEQDEKGDV